VSGGVPPVRRAGRARVSGRDPQLKQAARLYADFTGHDAMPIGTVRVPPLPSTVAIIGTADGVLYTTVRDGREESYIHEFAEKDKPMLGVSPDGRQILFIGGRYVFTDRGIVDLSDTKNLPPKYRALARRLRAR